MSPSRQVGSSSPKRSISIRFRVEDLEVINDARSILDETFQRFIVKQMLQASREIIARQKPASRKTAEN